MTERQESPTQMLRRLNSLVRSGGLCREDLRAVQFAILEMIRLWGESGVPELRKCSECDETFLVCSGHHSTDRTLCSDACKTRAFRARAKAPSTVAAAE